MTRVPLTQATGSCSVYSLATFQHGSIVWRLAQRVCQLASLLLPLSQLQKRVLRPVGSASYLRQNWCHQQACRSRHKEQGLVPTYTTCGLLNRGPCILGDYHAGMPYGKTEQCSENQDLEAFWKVLCHV